jgi:hypothetical protein
MVVTMKNADFYNVSPCGYCDPDDGDATFFRNVVLTRATRHNIPQISILHSHRHENLKSDKCSYFTLANSNLILDKIILISRE